MRRVRKLQMCGSWRSAHMESAETWRPRVGRAVRLLSIHHGLLRIGNVLIDILLQCAIRGETRMGVVKVEQRLNKSVLVN